MQNIAKNILTEGKSLLIDASGESICVALFSDAKLVEMKTVKGGALENIFALIKDVCELSSVRIADIKNFGFCEGVGSILGIRASSAACSVFRACSKDSLCFAWDLLTCYAKILSKTHTTFSLLCPSRKGYANVLKASGSSYACSEILTSEILDLQAPKFLISQRKLADKNFESIEEIYFDCSQIFEVLLEKDEQIKIAKETEIFDAKVLAKREYVKWNSATHS